MVKAMELSSESIGTSVELPENEVEALKEVSKDPLQITYDDDAERICSHNFKSMFKYSPKVN